MKPVCTTYHDGRQCWYMNGKLHREDGPAVIDPYGTQVWLLNGKRHREDGPAVIYTDGSQYWYMNDKEITKLVSNWAKERNIDLNNLSHNDRIILKLELKIMKD
jgi:(2Fe-2S) ferredoxin